MGPWVYSAAALLVDAVTGRVVFQRNADDQRPVASITKVMTALTFLDTHPDLDRPVVIAREDMIGAGQTRLRAGEVIRLRDVLHFALMVSDNVAARTLARNSGLGSTGFVYAMNDRARTMGLTHTAFCEPTGLYADNLSTAREIASMLMAASRDSVISEVMQTQEYTASTSRRAHTLHNTNRLLASRWDIKAGKTGYTTRAGYCFATCISDPKNDSQYTGVVLGAPTAATRFADMSRMMAWATTPAAAPAR